MLAVTEWRTGNFGESAFVDEPTVNKCKKLVQQIRGLATACPFSLFASRPAQSLSPRGYFIL